MLKCCFDYQEKCEQYWPEQTNVTETKGTKFNITVTSFVPSAEYQTRKIHLRSVSIMFHISVKYGMVDQEKLPGSFSF